MWSPKPDHPLRRMFAGLTEQTFINTLGVADPRLTDYLSELLSRFIHMDAVYRLSNVRGRKLEEVADMMIEAEAMPPAGRTRREVYRHIGDFTLFWSGVFPEALRRMRSPLRKDELVDYCERGKRSYYIASTMRERDDDEQSGVLERLSHDFELCVYGLGEVRREWERRDDGAPPPMVLE